MGVGHDMIDETRRSVTAATLREQDEILVVLESITNQLEPDAFDGNVAAASNRAWPSRIKQRAVAIAAMAVNVAPGILLAAIRFVHVVVELALNSIFPSQPRHDPVCNRVSINQVTLPTSIVVASDAGAAVTGA